MSGFGTFTRLTGGSPNKMSDCPIDERLQRNKNINMLPEGGVGSWRPRKKRIKVEDHKNTDATIGALQELETNSQKEK